MQDFTKGLNRPELIFPEEELDDYELEQEKNSTKGTVKAIIAHGNKAFQTVVEHGNVIVSKSSEILEKGKTFWEDPFGIKSTIKMIIAVVAGVALLIGVCVIYWKGRIYFMLLDPTQKIKSAHYGFRCREEADPVGTVGRRSPRGRGLYLGLRTESLPDRDQKEMLHKCVLKWEENAGTIRYWSGYNLCEQKNGGGVWNEN
uniref:Uncharacterized protein n=1 Tax=Meloidogyne javanica TaxID=6303 RepID=A0A915M0R9_MELJA